MTTKGSLIYPRASAPVTVQVLRAANDRAERWRLRYEAKVAECEALSADGSDR